jgi:hypothetical protein
MHTIPITSQGKLVHRMHVELGCLLRRKQQRRFAAPHNARLGADGSPCCSKLFVEGRHHARVIACASGGPPQHIIRSGNTFSMLIAHSDSSSLPAQHGSSKADRVTAGPGCRVALASIVKGFPRQIQRPTARKIVPQPTAWCRHTPLWDNPSIPLSVRDDYAIMFVLSAELSVLTPPAPAFPQQTILQMSG